MKCPICFTDLSIGEKQKYETLSDHVCDPNGDLPYRITFVCENKTCKLHQNSFWDSEGEFYTSLSFSEVDDIFNVPESDRWTDTNKNSCHAAMGSFARKVWFEVSYKEQTKKIFFGKYGFFIKAIIEADDDGNILKRRYKIEWLEKDGNGCIYKRWGVFQNIHTFFYFIKRARYFYKSYLGDNKSNYYLKDLKNYCDKTYFTNIGSWDRVLACKVNNFLYKKVIEEKK